MVPWARDKDATVADGAADAAGNAGAAGAAGNAGASGAAGAAVRPWTAIWLRITLICAIFEAFGLTGAYANPVLKIARYCN